MAEKYRFPKPNAPFVQSSGEPTVEWYNWLRSLENLFEASDSGLQAQITAIAYALGSPDGTVANIPPLNDDFLPTDTNVRGENSIVNFGTLASGLVVLMLENDTDAPGNTYYYGTNELGEKGWHLRALMTLADVDQTAPFVAGDTPVFDGTLFQPTAVLANPMTTLGDIITADTGGVPQALPVGANGEVLTVVSGEPAWQAPSGSRTPNVQTVTSSATVTPTFSDDIVLVTAQAVALALMNPTGTPIPELGMVIRLKDDGTPRVITYDTQYRAIGVTLPTITVTSKTLYLAMIYNSADTKWDVLAVGQEA